MIKFVADAQKTTLIGLGLSRKNTEKLLEGQPISVPLNTLGLDSDITILLFGGETEDEMEKSLKVLNEKN